MKKWLLLIAILSISLAVPVMAQTNSGTCAGQGGTCVAPNWCRQSALNIFCGGPICPTDSTVGQTTDCNGICCLPKNPVCCKIYVTTDPSKMYKWMPNNTCRPWAGEPVDSSYCETQVCCKFTTIAGQTSYKYYPQNLCVMTPDLIEGPVDDTFCNPSPTPECSVDSQCQWCGMNCQPITKCSDGKCVCPMITSPTGYDCKCLNNKCQYQQTPPGSCVEGASQCDGNNVMQCKGGQWALKQACQYQCKEYPAPCYQPLEGTTNIPTCVNGITKITFAVCVPSECATGTSKITIGSRSWCAENWIIDFVTQLLGKIGAIPQ